MEGECTRKRFVERKVRHPRWEKRRGKKEGRKRGASVAGRKR
jgi:hypothetical protein